MFKYDQFPVLNLQVYNSQGILLRKTYRLKSNQPYFQNENFSLINIIDYQTSQHMTLKKILKTKNLSKDLTLSQIQNQTKMKNNDNFMQIKQVYEDDDNIYLFMEENHSSLKEILAVRKVLFECEVQYIFCQLVFILENLRKNNIFHGGISLSNLFLDSTTIKIKLSGFDNSANMEKFHSGSHGNLFSFGDLPPYIAPELLQCNVDNGENYYAADIWAVGVVIYALLIGYEPFITYEPHSKLKIASLMKIKNCIFQFPNPNLNLAQDLNSNPKQRCNQLKMSIKPVWKQLLKRIFLPRTQRIKLIQLINHPLTKITQSKFLQLKSYYPPTLVHHNVCNSDSLVGGLRFQPGIEKILSNKQNQIILKKQGNLNDLQLFKKLIPPPNLQATVKTIYQSTNENQFLTGGQINSTILSLILQQQKSNRQLPFLSYHPSYIERYSYIKKYNCLGYIYQNNIGVIYSDGSCLIGRNMRQYVYLNNTPKNMDQLCKDYVSMYQQYYQTYNKQKIKPQKQQRIFRLDENDYINQTNRLNRKKLSGNSNTKNFKKSFQQITSTAKISPANSSQNYSKDLSTSKIKKYKLQDYSNNIASYNNNSGNQFQILNSYLKQTKFNFHSNSSFNINSMTKNVGSTNSINKSSQLDIDNKFANSADSQQFPNCKNTFSQDNNCQTSCLQNSFNSFNNLRQKQVSTKKQINLQKLNIYEYFIGYFGERVIDGSKQDWVVGFWRLNCGIIMLYKSGLWQVNFIQVIQSKKNKELELIMEGRSVRQSDKNSDLNIKKQCAVLIDSFGLAWYLDSDSQAALNPDIKTNTPTQNTSNSSNFPCLFDCMQNINTTPTNYLKYKMQKDKNRRTNKSGLSAVCVKIARKGVKQIKDRYIKQFEEMMEPYRYRS